MALIDYLILNRLRGLSDSDIACVSENLTESEALLTRSTSVLKKLGFSSQCLKQIEQVDLCAIEQELAWASQAHHHVVTLFDDAYPELLKEIHRPPVVLFVWGDASCLKNPQLAMVGSRHPTPLGRETAEEFAAYLVNQGLTITSGLAMGIDTASHRGALKYGQTIAVLGSGLNQLYPKQNIALAEEIAEKGAVISEFPLTMPPKKENFPQRNRVISGMSLGVLVVEAAVQSGSLITAKWALNQGREIFAMPGSIHNPLAKGCHRLIREGAKLVETAENVWEELTTNKFELKHQVHSQQLMMDLGDENQEDSELSSQEIPKNGQNQKNETEKNRSISLDEDYCNLLSCICFEVTAVDTIIARSGLSPEVVSSMLLLLELQGYITSVPGGYCRIKK